MQTDTGIIQVIHAGSLPRTDPASNDARCAG